MPVPPIDSGQEFSLSFPEGPIPHRPPLAINFEDYFNFLLFFLETFPPGDPLPSGPRVPFRL